MQAQPFWSFKRIKPGDQERESVSEEFFSNDTRLSAIIRESIQNSLDAYTKDENGNRRPVRVRIFFSGTDSLPGSEYAKYRNGAEEHYRNPRNKLPLPLPELDDPCPYVVIEDFQTTGLTGDPEKWPADNAPRQDCNYYNYFFRENGTSKESSDSLGSWGAGKCVFQRASRLKTSLTMSVRDDGRGPQAFLVGKATLRIHTDADGKKWGPDGWFGFSEEWNESNPDRIPNQPITSPDWLQRFREDFHLVRQDEPGTSIVIPYLMLAESSEDETARFNRKNLVRAVLTNFLVSMLNGELEVEIQIGIGGDVVHVDREHLKDYQEYLPLPDERAVVVTRLHRDLVEEVSDGKLPPEAIFQLSSPGPKPNWVPVMFKDIDLKAMKKRLQAKKSLLVRVPMPIRQKNPAGGVIIDQGTFDVAIRRADLPRAFPPIFYRLGLLVDAVKAPATNYYISAVLIGDNPTAKMLVAAEPPSHNEWKRDADRLTQQYDIPWSHLLFVTTSVREILNAVDSADKELSFDQLMDIFSITKQHDNEPDSEKGDSKKPKEEPEDNGEHNDEQKKHELKERLVEIVEVQGARKGFKLKDGPGLAAAKSFPLHVKLVCGYDTFGGLDWNLFDFDLAKTDQISVDVQGDNIQLDMQNGNQLAFSVLKAAPFSISVTGFDANRDVVVDKIRYSYDEQNTETDEEA